MALFRTLNAKRMTRQSQFNSAAHFSSACIMPASLSERNESANDVSTNACNASNRIVQTDLDSEGLAKLLTATLF